MTRGEYFYAGTAEDLKKVYQSLNSRLIIEKKETEITALFAAVGALSRCWLRGYQVVVRAGGLRLSLRAAGAAAGRRRCR